MGEFLESVLVHTEYKIKTIKDIVVGDRVINKNGCFETVTKIERKQNEDKQLVKITHLFGSDKHFPIVCSDDCQVLIKNNNETRFEFAKNVKKGDYICVPKMKMEDNYPNIVDLNNYNIFGFDYDDEYIYEELTSPNPYKYSPMDVSRKIGVSFSLVEKFARENCNENLFVKKPEKLRELFEYIPFNTRMEYIEYVKSFRMRKIKRFLIIDKTFNQFIGLMYGDGYTKKKYKDYPVANIALVINADNFKNVINRSIFEEIAERIGLEVVEYERFSRGRSIELHIYSRIFCNFFSSEFFESKAGKEKIFNKSLFCQSNENLNGLLEGMIYSDGHRCEKYVGFSNTSMSLLNAVKLLYLMTETGVPAIEYTPPRTCSMNTSGRKGKPSMNIRKSLRKSKRIQDMVFSDDNYYYLPVKKVIPFNSDSDNVYFLQTDKTNEFLLNNMIVKGAA